MKSTLKNMVISLTAISAVMGGLLAGVHQLTADAIAEAQSQVQQQALRAVLPVFDNNPIDDVQYVVVEGLDRQLPVYRATRDGIVVGYAVESYTMDGFSGEIDVMVGFDSEGALCGYQVLQHSETPGLGAKADEWFRDTAPGRSVIGSVGPLSVSKDGGTIDGITAATITSRAFLDAINNARVAIESF